MNDSATELKARSDGERRGRPARFSLHPRPAPIQETAPGGRLQLFIRAARGRPKPRRAVQRVISEGAAHGIH